MGAASVYHAGGGTLTWYRDRLGRGEHHFTDTTVSVAINTGGSVTLLNDIAEGTSTQERTGRKIAMSGVTFRMVAENDTAAIWNKCVIMLVEDLRPIGSLPGAGDIVESITSDALNNEAGFGRFKIHMRKTFILRGPGEGGTVDSAAPFVRSFDKFKPLKAREVHYSGASGTIGQIIKGALYLVVFGNRGAGTGDANLDGNIRVAFKDVH